MSKSVFEIKIDNKTLSDYGDHGSKRLCCDDPDQVKQILEKELGKGTVKIRRLRQE